MLSVALAIVLSVPSIPYTWRNVEVVGGGFVTGIITHPKARDVVYARTDIGGAYRWNPKTECWVPLQDWLTRPDWNLYGVESLAVDPSDTNRVYIAAGTYTNQWGSNGAILRSSDRGRTWKRTDLPFKNGGNEEGRGIGERLAVDPFDGKALFFGTRNNGLWRSDDRGTTWSQVTNFPVTGRTNGVGIGWVLFNPYRRGDLIVGVAVPGAPIYRSRDGGATWAGLFGIDGLLPHHAAIGADGTLYVTYGNAPGPNGVTKGMVCKIASTGVGSDITPIAPSDEDKFGYGGISLDRLHPGTLIVSTVDRWGKDTIFRSVNGGGTWASLADQAVRDSSKAPYLKWGRPEADFGHWIADCEIDPVNSNRAWYVTGATIWTTNDLTNSVTHWVPGAQGLEETAVLKLVSPPAGAHVVSALGDIGGFAHTDLSVSPRGGVWTNPLLNTVTDLDFAEHKPNRFVRVGNAYSGAQHGATSVDGAQTWKPLATDPPGYRGGGSAAISADGAVIVWAPNGSDGAYRTLDEGATWQRCEGLPPRARLISDRVDPNTLYAHDLAGGAVYVSNDGAATFTKAASGLPEDAGRPVAVYGRRGELWLPTPEGLLRSIDGGETFTKVAGVQRAEQVGFGKAASGAAFPTIYLIGMVDGVIGVFRSTDEGKTWKRINDAKSGFGTMNTITGDPKLFGRVYVGTNGRGVLVADSK